METLQQIPTCSSAAWLAFFACTNVAMAQPLQLSLDRAAPVHLTEPRVDVVAGATATRLEQAHVLTAEKNWDDAVDILRELAAEGSDRVVELNQGRYVSLRTACHLEIARLPAEGLAAYRRRVDPLAERWYRDGLDQRDARLLRRVVDELFCSSWGDDALMALGELALERGDYAAARRYWQQISPLLRDPAGRSMWIALRDIDLAAHWPQIKRRWHDRTKPATWLAYPDTQVDLADVRARLVLTSIRDGQLKRAALELEAFRLFHSDSAGRLGGKDGPYFQALERLMEGAPQWPTPAPETDWPTFAGAPSRSSAVAALGPVTGPIWREPIELTRPAAGRRSFPTDATRQDNAHDNSQTPAIEAPLPSSHYPVVVDGVVLYADGARLYAADLMTGQPAITKSGVLYREDSSEHASQTIAGPLTLGWRDELVAAYGVPRYTLSAIEGVVFGRFGRPATAPFVSRESQAGDRLVGINLSRDGALAFRVRPRDTKWSFDGVPVGDGRRLFIAMRKNDVSPHSYVACYDVATSNQLWRTPIGAADTPATGYGDEITHNLLTLTGDRLYFNTNLGLVAALDAATGDLCWLRRYDRLSGPSIIRGRPGPPQLARDPAPCLFHEGLVVVAPSDAPEIFAIDAGTGQTVWTCDALPDAIHLLGVVRNNLIVSGHRLAAIDARSGKLRFAWPESPHAGIRGMGRGIVAGDEVFWPTRDEIYVIHGVTGAQSRAPIPLGGISEYGANLAAAAGRLVVAGPDKLMAFGPALPIPPNQNKAKIEPVAQAK